MMRYLPLLLVLMLCAAPAVAQDRPLELGAGVVVAAVSELDVVDTGIAGRLAWLPMPEVGIEAEVAVFPANVPESPAISSSRVEGLFGVTVGPQLGTLRPFVRLRPGFMRIGAAPEPVACILIFPQPLTCALAAGSTLFVADVGGGVSLDVAPAMLLRIDVGDRMTRYPGPAFGRGRRIIDSSFLDHDLRLGVGVAWRF